MGAGGLSKCKRGKGWGVVSEINHYRYRGVGGGVPKCKKGRGGVVSEINKLWVQGGGWGTYTDVFSLKRTSPPPPPQHAGSFRVEFHQFADSSHAKNKAEHPADLFCGAVF